MRFEAIVKRIVRTKSEKGTNYKVQLVSEDKHRVILNFTDEASTIGYIPNLVVEIEIKNPQEKLQEALKQAEK